MATAFAYLLAGKPFDVVWHTIAGVRFKATRRTAAHLLWTIERLAAEHPDARLRIIQPSYNTGVMASAGTHDKDAAFDVEIVGLDWWDAQWFLRRHGWAAWVRFPPAFGWHIHMISIPPNGRTFPQEVGIYIDGGLSLNGRVTTSSQLADYYLHTLGLAGQHNVDLDKSRFPGDEGPAPWPVGTPDQWRRDIDRTIFDFALWEREMEDSMGFTEWSKKDQNALVDAVADRVVDRLLNASIAAKGEKPLPVEQALRQAARGPEASRQVGKDIAAVLNGTVKAARQ